MYILQSHFIKHKPSISEELYIQYMDLSFLDFYSSSLQMEMPFQLLLLRAVDPPSISFPTSVFPNPFPTTLMLYYQVLGVTMQYQTNLKRTQHDKNIGKSCCFPSHRYTSLSAKEKQKKKINFVKDVLCEKHLSISNFLLVLFIGSKAKFINMLSMS